MSIASSTLAKAGAALIRVTSLRAHMAGPGELLGFQFDPIGRLRHLPGHPRRTGARQFCGWARSFSLDSRESTEPGACALLASLTRANALASTSLPEQAPARIPGRNRTALTERSS